MIFAVVFHLQALIAVLGRMNCSALADSTVPLAGGRALSAEGVQEGQGLAMPLI